MKAVLSLLLTIWLSVHAFILQPSTTLRSIYRHRLAAQTETAARTGTFDLNRIKEAGFPNAYIASTEKEAYGRPERRIPKWDAPIVVLPDFLTGEECDEIMRVGAQLEREGVVADMYLNHRLNKEVKSDSTSMEAMELIQDQNLDEEELAADSLSGFRAPLPPSVLLAGQPLIEGNPRGQPVAAPPNSIGSKVLKLLGCGDRKLAFLEDEWINPNKERIMIRDQTMVHYRVGEGVPPHVDGNHATVLVYLADVEVGAGGRTIFPEAGIASVPKRGSALLYCSKGQRLLHFAERVKANEKWVMQMLIDYTYRSGGASNVI